MVENAFPSNGKELVELVPTAVQPDEDEHETLTRRANCDPVGFGVGRTVQFVPFQCSASVTCKPELSTSPPTATHAEDDTHETESRFAN
jgi:hypothetical protein